MILKSLKLQNIRSYVSQDIEFPENSLMLWGDIGSGKSTILLAIEFALFGILRGTVEGSSLLRHGTRDGSVELSFLIGKEPITIKRTLKRTDKNVQQTAGYILRNNTKYEGTAVELKTRILDILGYPKELLTKSKAMIFRYTVYTPQEEMKHILYEKPEERLDTLRRVFGMERYKRIKENAVTYMRELREKRKEAEGKTADIPQKKAAQKEQEEEISIITKEINETAASLKQSHQVLELEQKKLQDCEKNIEKMHAIQQQIKIEQLKLENLVRQKQQDTTELLALEKQIESLKKEVTTAAPQNIRQQLEETEKQLRTSEEEASKLRAETASLGALQTSCEEIKQKITKLDSCPLCEQNVSHEHKHSIMQREDKKIHDLNKQSAEKQAAMATASKKAAAFSQHIEQLRIQDRETELAKLKHSSLKEKLNRQQKILAGQADIKKNIGAVNTKLITLRNDSTAYAKYEKSLKEQKASLLKTEQQHKEIEIAAASLQTKREGVERILNLVKKELQEKLLVQAESAKLMKISQWVEEFLIKLVTTIEKHIMTNVYVEFNELFQNWFRILIEDESLNVRLNDEFTPVIEQDGYETTLDSLSGGEKNSCALAYRLALNKVVNDLLSTIQTKDLIILDEPTDGFSNEQIDRMRDVLDELNVQQIIIVSHESKMESFVENVIRIHKESHISRFS